MKVKEIERFGFSAWSPESCKSTILATLTAEEVDPPLDESNSDPPPLLELFPLRLQDSNLSMQPSVTMEMECRSTCVCWTSPSQDASLGLIISGDAFGGLTLYAPHDLLVHLDDQEDGPVVTSSPPRCDVDHAARRVKRPSIHTGVVRNMDANRFQINLFASVADESEVLIWDVDKMDQPMSPGNKIQPLESISTVAWNPRVQHILATAGASNCTVWDLRRSDPVLQLSKSMCQLEPHLMAWSPDVATRLCLADPSHPSADIQLWDLRFPKHALALLARWPPPTSGNLYADNALGNAATVNALAWCSGVGRSSQAIGSDASKRDWHDPDFIAVSLTASGAFPTRSTSATNNMGAVGLPGTCLQPNSADFVVVWSAQEALHAPRNDGTTSYCPQPLFVGRLEDEDADDPVLNSTAMGSRPTNAAIQWLPTQPGLLSCTQPDGWISVLNLCAGPDLYTSTMASSPRALRSRDHGDGGRGGNGTSTAHQNRARHASHKLAAAFGDQVTEMPNSPAMHLGERMGSVTLDGSSPAPSSTAFDWSNAANTQVGMLQRTVEPQTIESLPLLPQPLPRLRVAPQWMKRSCGATFAFGGRLVWFASDARANALSTDASSANSDVKRVNLQWVDTSSSEETVTGSADPMAVTWLNEVVVKGGDSTLEKLGWSDEQLSTICGLSEIRCGSQLVHPLPLLNAISQTVDTTHPSILSGLLGYDWNVIRDRLQTAIGTQTGAAGDGATPILDNEDVTDQSVDRLDLLKMGLVIGDYGSSVLLMLKSTTSNMPCPGVSPLSALALLLANQSGEMECQHSVHQTILTSLDSASAMDPRWRAIQLLAGYSKCLPRTADWTLRLSSEWPLTDWTTALAVFVNLVWPTDKSRFFALCDDLTERLLNAVDDEKSDYGTLTRQERFSAAWLCSVVSGNWDNVVRAWCGMQSIDLAEAGGAELVPLAIQILLLSKPDVPTGSSDSSFRKRFQISSSAAEILTRVALWLVDKHAGRHDSDLDVTSFQLFLLAASAVTVNPMDPGCVAASVGAHRLWCGLAEEQREAIVARFGFIPIQCPYQIQQGSGFVRTRRCPCATTTSQASVTPRSAPTNRAIPPSVHTLSTPTMFQPSQSYTPPVGGPLMPPMPTQATAVVSPTDRSMPPTFPPMPSGHISSPFQSSAFPNPPVPMDPSQLSFATPPIPVMLPPTGPLPSPPPTQAPLPPPPATSRAWNDPPVLTGTYQPPPPRPILAINHFYDPAQFSNEPNMAQFPPSCAAALQHPSTNPQLPMPPRAPVAPQSGPPVPPIQTVSPLNYPFAPIAQPSIPPGPSVLQMSRPRTNQVADERFGGESTRPMRNGGGMAPSFTQQLPPNNMTNYSGQMPMNSNQWPAAAPLGVGGSQELTLLTPMAANEVASMEMNESPQQLSSNSIPETVEHTNPQFEAIENTLVQLIQLCRSVGGKTYASKMDIVERRLQGLFTALRSSDAGSTLSAQVLTHLNDCVQFASQADYTAAVEHANRLIQSAAGFESIHGFAPGLRILMQSARQLFPQSKSVESTGAANMGLQPTWSLGAR